MNINEPTEVIRVLNKIKELVSVNQSETIVFELESPGLNSFYSETIEYKILEHLMKIRILSMGPTMGLESHLGPPGVGFVTIWKRQLYVDTKAFERYWTELELPKFPGMITVGNRLKKTLLSFDKSNGDLKIGDYCIGRLTPSSAEYYFVEILYSRHDLPVAHKEIYDYCQKKLGREMNDSIQNFCNKTKNLIKNKCDELISDIIISTKTPKGENAYRMMNPDSKTMQKFGIILGE